MSAEQVVLQVAVEQAKPFAQALHVGGAPPDPPPPLEIAPPAPAPTPPLAVPAADSPPPETPLIPPSPAPLDPPAALVPPVPAAAGTPPAPLRSEPEAPTFVSISPPAPPDSSPAAPASSLRSTWQFLRASQELNFDEHAAVCAPATARTPSKMHTPDFETLLETAMSYLSTASQDQLRAFSTSAEAPPRGLCTNADRPRNLRVEACAAILRQRLCRARPRQSANNESLASDPGSHFTNGHQCRACRSSREFRPSAPSPSETEPSFLEQTVFDAEGYDAARVAP